MCRQDRRGLSPPWLVLIAGLSAGHKVVLAVQSGQRESPESWSRPAAGSNWRGVCAVCSWSSATASWGCGRGRAMSIPKPTSSTAGTSASSICWLGWPSGKGS